MSPAAYADKRRLRALPLVTERTVQTRRVQLEEIRGEERRRERPCAPVDRKLRKGETISGKEKRERRAERIGSTARSRDSVTVGLVVATVACEHSTALARPNNANASRPSGLQTFGTRNQSHKNFGVLGEEGRLEPLTQRFVCEFDHST